MKRLLATAGLILLTGWARLAVAAGPDDLYITIYTLIQQGDTLSEEGQIRPAIAKYTEAQVALQKFKAAYPSWNEKVISYRLNYVAGQLAPLTAKLPPEKNVPPTPGPTPPGTTPPGTTPPPNPNPPVTSDIDVQIKTLTDEIQRLESNNKLLTAKLKEALSVQPAGVDPKEIAKIEDKAKTLQKENELLKVSLEQEKIKSSQMADASAAVAAVNQALAENKARLSRQEETLAAVQSENEILKKQAQDLRQQSDANSAESTRLLEQATAKMGTLLANYEAMRSEKMVLESRLNQATAQAARSQELETQLSAAQQAGRVTEAELAKLRAENSRFERNLADLEKQLAKTGAAAADTAKADEAKRRQLEQELLAARTKAKVTEKNLELASAAAQEKDSLARKLQKEKEDLEKEKEALRARVARGITPSESSSAAAQLASQKQRDLERQLAAARSIAGDSADQARKLQKDKADLEKQKLELEAKLAQAGRADLKKRQQLEQDIAAAAARSRVLDKNLGLVADLNRDNEAIARKLQKDRENFEKERAAGAGTAAISSSADTARLRQQQRELDRQLSAAKAAAEEKADQARQLQKDKATLEKQRADLESKLSKTTATSAETIQMERIRREQLDREMGDLRKKLELAEKERSTTRVPSAAENKRTETMLARLEVLQAKPVPYSAEELALFSKSGVTPNFASLSTTPPGSVNETPLPRLPVKRVHQMPAGSRPLVAEAERAAQAGDFAKAEARYRDVLRQDENNVNTLANLASMELALNHANDAEKNILKALAVDPDDDFSLYVLGRVKFSQGKYDDALDALSRSAKLNPDNADTQNYLGIALSEKGLRQPAETALRRALQIRPGHADAHNNLAVVYITQQPPASALARWHYQKSLAAGHSRNPALEKLLEAAR